MKKLYFLLIVLLLSAGAFAQSKTQPKAIHLAHPAAAFYSASRFSGQNLVTKTDIAAFLEENFPAVKYGKFRLVKMINSPLGRHFLYRQIYAGFPVYKTELKLNVGKSGEVLSVTSALHPLPEKREIKYNKHKNNLAEKHLKKIFGSHTTEVKYQVEQELFIQENALHAGILLTYGSKNTSFGSKEILLNLKGDVVDEYNLITNYKKEGHSCGAHVTSGAKAAVRDTSVSALVYRQVPAPSGTIDYLQNLLTRPREFQDLLSAQRQPVDLVVGFRNDTFLLQTPFCIIKEFDPPASPVGFSLTPNFDYRLGDDGFEQVNILYHITLWQKYIQSLGLKNLSNNQIEVDANGWKGRDQSSYSSFTNTLSFGTGGVKDGQDPQVIIHEYSHAITRQATLSGAVGYERKVLEEANADYFAVSYKKTSDSTDWHKIYTWDGHNEFWPGRLAISDKIYPSGLENDIYKDAALWTATLMQIHHKLGAEITDRLVLHSLYSYSSYTDLPAAARLLLQTEKHLYKGKYKKVIADALIARGLIEKAGLVATK